MNNSFNNLTQQKIVIIGAGLAGLTCAYKLSKKGLNVELYEARPRIGGRILTGLIKNLDNENSIIELGAQNISDGGDAKNIINLLKDLKLGNQLISIELPLTSKFFDGKNFHNDSEVFPNLNYKTTLKILEKAKLNSNSMQDVLDKTLINNNLAKRAFTFLMSAYEGSKPDKLSVYHNIETYKYMLLGGLSEAHQSKHITIKSLKNGNAFLLSKLAENLNGKLHLNKELKKVCEDNSLLKLTFNDNSEVICNKLILTIPAPIYKNIEFNNVLNKSILNKIEKVQYGNTAKIMMPIKYEQLEIQTVFSDYMSTFFNLDRKVLNMYFVNDDGINFKNIFNTQKKLIKDGYKNSIINENNVVDAIEKQFVNYDSPVAKSWIIDEYSQGSYSNFGTKLNEEFGKKEIYQNISVKSIFKPINDKIYFAGEHTTINDDIIGTMEAAAESGNRIAELILNEA